MNDNFAISSHYFFEDESSERCAMIFYLEPKLLMSCKLNLERKETETECFNADDLSPIGEVQPVIGIKSHDAVILVDRNNNVYEWTLGGTYNKITELHKPTTHIVCTKDYIVFVYKESDVTALYLWKDKKLDESQLSSSGMWDKVSFWRPKVTIVDIQKGDREIGILRSTGKYGRVAIDGSHGGNFMMDSPKTVVDKDRIKLLNKIFPSAGIGCTWDECCHCTFYSLDHTKRNHGHIDGMINAVEKYGDKIHIAYLDSHGMQHCITLNESNWETNNDVKLRYEEPVHNVMIIEGCCYALAWYPDRKLKLCKLVPV